MSMDIHHGNHYESWIHENGEDIAYAGFYSKSTIEESKELMVGYSDLFLVIGLDISKEPNRTYGCYDFAEDYARKVAQMVYEMLLMS